MDDTVLIAMLGTLALLVCIDIIKEAKRDYKSKKTVMKMCPACGYTISEQVLLRANYDYPCPYCGKARISQFYRKE